MLQYSETTHLEYEAEDAVFYRNVIQSAWMLSHPDCTLLDIFTDGSGKLVFCFPKEQHKRWIKDWANRPHDKEDK